MSLPIVLSEYFHSSTGKDYSIGLFDKIKLLFKMRSNGKKIKTASHFLEHMAMATQILKLSPEVEGCVVECGSFKGGSAANLSLVCALGKRHLQIFDSFRGLPAPSQRDREHLVVGKHEIHTYAEGSWHGTLDEVKRNISSRGIIGICHFNAGYFADTLPALSHKCVLAFLDVDLTESLQTCVRHLWPLLQDGCCLFTHEAHHTEIAAFFYDDTWWRANLGCQSPGLVGAGTGLGLLPAAGGFCSSLGYTVKNPRVLDFHVSPQTGIFGTHDVEDREGKTAVRRVRGDSGG